MGYERNLLIFPAHWGLMLKIGYYGDAALKIPESAYFSFFNSPYVGHRTGTAVDVYYQENALYPLEEGKVLEIRRVNPPRYIPVDEDYLMVIRAGKICLKVLHVKPTVSLGDKVGLGDEIGKQILSGFFRPWSDKHAHFELRDCRDAYRARGAYPINPIILRRVPLWMGNMLEIKEKKEHYVWARPVKRGSPAMTPLGESEAQVEGGLPYYGYGAIYGKDVVEMQGCRIWGERIHSGVYVFFHVPEFKVNGRSVRGLGFYCNQEKIKILGTEFEEGDVVEVQISCIQN